MLFTFAQHQCSDTTVKLMTTHTREYLLAKRRNSNCVMAMKVLLVYEPLNFAVPVPLSTFLMYRLVIQFVVYAMRSTLYWFYIFLEHAVLMLRNITIHRLLSISVPQSRGMVILLFCQQLKTAIRAAQVIDVISVSVSVFLMLYSFFGKHSIRCLPFYSL